MRIKHRPPRHLKCVKYKKRGAKNVDEVLRKKRLEIELKEEKEEHKEEFIVALPQGRRTWLF